MTASIFDRGMRDTCCMVILIGTHSLGATGAADFRCPGHRLTFALTLALPASLAHCMRILLHLPRSLSVPPPPPPAAFLLPGTACMTAFLGATSPFIAGDDASHMQHPPEQRQCELR
jgi:hypothetical protein